MSHFGPSRPVPVRRIWLSENLFDSLLEIIGGAKIEALQIAFCSSRSRGAVCHVTEETSTAASGEGIVIRGPTPCDQSTEG
jgi:hypothetical protein